MNNIEETLESKWITGIGNFNLRRSQVRKRGKIGFNQSLICIQHFRRLSPQFFYLPLLNSVNKSEKCSEVGKILKGHMPLLRPRSYVCVCNNYCLCTAKVATETRLKLRLYYLRLLWLLNFGFCIRKLTNSMMFVKML